MHDYVDGYFADDSTSDQSPFDRPCVRFTELNSVLEAAERIKKADFLLPKIYF